jgi:CRISPR-associated protein Cmr2
MMSQDNANILHFSLGPVQGFIGQARRTRDLWAGSFLLSWLAGHAIKAVLDADGEISFPSVGSKQTPSDPLLAAILGTPLDSDPTPCIGSLPNRFKARVPGSFDPKQVETSVRKAWRKVADAIWDKYVQAVSPQDRNTEAIWQRQICGFWEINWVIGPDPGDITDSAWLDARKNWRVPGSLKPEGGDHCTVMHDLQELSGYIRSHEQQQQKHFWKALRKQTRSRLDLRPDERLCAIALIKRLYPKIAKQAIGWSIDVRNWPSTAYMAAAHWIENTWASDSKQCEEYAELVQQTFEQGAYAEGETKLTCLEGVDRRFKGIDGNAFHIAALKNKLVTFLKEEDQRAGLIESLRNLQYRTQEKKNIGPTPFYALLLMDGDRLGKLLREHSNTAISRALADFTKRAPEVVKQHNGVAVYAGGDDLLALLPLEDALPAATGLNEVYGQAFDSVDISDSAFDKTTPTISGTIVYAHYRWPLRGVLTEAHHLLDKIAKEGNGRASLAVSVLQSSGKNVEWVAAWDSSAPENLCELAEAHRKEPHFSTRLLHSINELFRMWAQSPEKEDHSMPIDFSEDELLELLIAQDKRNREDEKWDRDQSEKDMRKLLEICLRHSRKPADDLKEQRLIVQPSGAKLLRFIARRGESL